MTSPIRLALDAGPLPPGGPFFGGINSLKNFADKAFTTSGAASVQNATERFDNPLLGRLMQYIMIAEGFVGLILVCVIIYAGFLYMTAQGEEEKIRKVKQYLTNAVIGLIILLVVYSATIFVISNLIDVTTKT